ncbi:hypothetical protein TSOC_013737 [Tetrabaena socialis]|uniref:Uncharacterized protein n=1 Tax=Tetrabaena socialis TaxID=47790 RepID=A0A2J7ZJL2_9CHLO|nr:hypothetical protein TSOC_013737 [Tetrabaena socialis]|eukprot:PNH00440.1 hypothetical protein TSOC_013737 [Tetrabaena socialis]
MQQAGDLGSPLTERIIKTVGRGGPGSSPSPARSSGGTPAPSGPPKTPAPATDVKKIASVPLPDDEESEPYASSDSDAQLPLSPGQQPAPPTTSGSSSSGSGGSQGLWLFAMLSVVATLLIGVLLVPCADAGLYSAVRTPNYEHLCKELVRAHGRTADAAWHLYAQAAERAAELHSKLPPPAQQLLARARCAVEDAHAAALPLLSKPLAEAQQRLLPVQERALRVWRQATREAFTRLAPLLEAALAHAAAPSPIPIACISQADFLGLLDQSPAVQQHGQELWHAAARQVASKRKAPVWVITCGSEAEHLAVVGGLFSAASSFFRIEGAAYSLPDHAGTLQAELVGYLKTDPAGLVLVAQPDRLHPNSVAVLNAAMSEGGHLQMHGVPVATERALYVVLLEGVSSGAEGEAAVKDQLTRAMTEADPDAGDDAAAIARSFRRRLDAVLPARRLP